MKRNKIIYGLLLIVSASCQPKEIDKEMDAGDIDPTTFIAIGGSSTAGVLDDALSLEGQENSFAAILAEQLSLVGAGGFTQPFMSSNSVGVSWEGKSGMLLGYKTDCEGTSSLSPIRKALTGDQAAWNSNVFSSAFNNMGVPNLKSTELNVAGYGDPSNGAGNYNPFFARMASNQSTSSIASDILVSSPTFFSLFVGMDEVLAYAKKGASIGSLTPANGVAGVGFDGSIEQLVSSLTATGAKGVITTLPDVTEMPYFTTIPYDGLDLDAESAATLNEIYNPIDIYFQVGKNPFVIEDPAAGAFGVRLMTEGDLLLLSVPLDSVKCFKMGSVFPFRDEFILDEIEINQIQSAVNSYNSSLAAIANDHNLALTDGNTFYKKIKSGMVYNGISLDSRFVTGGAYSLDGIHLNPRANALFANEIIKSINLKYNARIPLADPTRYRGIIFP